MGKDVILKFKGGSGGTYNYDALVNKPKINGVEVAGELTGADLSLQNLLIAGDNITIEDNGDGTATISSEGGGNAKALIATYNQTTAQEIMTYLETEGDFAPVLVKRGNDYYTSISVAKKDSESVYVKTFGSLQGKYYIFTYTITEAVWATSTYGLAGETEIDQLYQMMIAALDSKQDLLTAGDNIVISPSNVIHVTGVPTDQDLADALAAKQDTLESGVNIKTINNISLLGSGNIDIQGGGTVDQTYDPTSTNAQSGTAVAEAVAGKADAASVYTKAESDALLDDKADASDVYTKAEVDSLIPDVSDFVTDAELTTGLATKADAATTYTKAEVDALIPDVSDFVTDTELATGLATKADAATTYTKSEVDALIPDVSDFVTDTELATGLATKADAATTYTKTEVDNLIPDVSGFVTQTDLTDGLALKADKSDTYTKAETDALIPDVSDFVTDTEMSDALALKADAATTYTKTEVDALIPDVSDFVTDTEMQTALVAKADASSVYTKTEMDVELDAKQDELVSGTNIKSINNQSLVGSGNLVFHDAFVAVYGTTTYADVVAAIDANKAIVVDFANNHNLLAVTYFTYGAAGSDVLMYAIYKSGNDVTLATITVTSENAWSITHANLQEQLVSGTSIKTVNNQSLLGSGNLDIGNDVYLINLATTPYWDIVAAVNAKKALIISGIGSLLGIGSDATVMPVQYRYASFAARIEFVFYAYSASGTGKAAYSLVYAEQDTQAAAGPAVWRVSESGTIQPKLVSGTTIKTLNNQSLLGSGNIDIPGGGTVDTAMSDTSENAVQNKVIKSYVDGATGDLSTLATDDKTSLVNAINEVYEKSGEPFRVKQWANNDLDVTIVPCTSDAGNTSLTKMVFAIDDVEGADYQIVGMIAYEVFDAASGGNRINCWPVCQFTGNGQKELSVRWMCGGTTNKVAKRISAWVLLKHR